MPVLFRESLSELGELDACREWFPTVTSRMDIRPNTLVVGRYSVLPYYEELEADLRKIGSRLINSHAEHQFIADITNWSGPPEEGGGLLNGLTPYTYTSWVRLPEGAYVVKGRTNSRKHQWNTHMFAKSRADLVTVARRLYDDPLVSAQGLVARPFIPLRTLDTGINDLPITHEWRTFWLIVEDNPVLVAAGPYWASHPDTCSSGDIPQDALSIAREAACRIAPHATFFSLDVAEKDDGGWIVIEVNDGQMSGLSQISPSEFYRSLYTLLPM